jgi:hypothetical protein
VHRKLLPGSQKGCAEVGIKELSNFGRYLFSILTMKFSRVHGFW